MKTFLKFLVVCCAASQAMGAPVDDDKIRSKFQKLVQALVECDASSLVATMHPATVKATATYFRKELAKRAGASQVDPSLPDEPFVVRIIEEAFRTSPQVFSFEAQKSIRIHGVLHDGPDVFLVYSTDSVQPGFRGPATLTFSQDHGEWKLWSMPLTPLVVGTWVAEADTDETPQAEQAAPSGADKPSN